MVRTNLLSRLINSIWLDEMPNIERIYVIIKDLYLAREMKQFKLEEDLYAKLVFLMRSRELVVKVTRYFDDPYDPEIIFDKKKASVASRL